MPGINYCNMNVQIQKLEQGIATLEAQRVVIGETVVDAMLLPLRRELATLKAQAQAAEAQRKLVTILFADVSGFTAMSEQMDAEDISQVMNALWQQVDSLIAAHGGRIDKHLGDGVMAIWSAETAREDDPERAIRAALAMQAKVQKATADPKSRLSTLEEHISMRIGIHTGPVLLGALGTQGEYTAMGDTVNLTARLEKAAPVGGVLISHDTYRHVRGVFDLQPLEPITVKGKADPVQTYLVLQARPRAFRLGKRGVEGVETRMIGRAAELRTLQQALQTVQRERHLQAITVVGEAGVGKSRLLYEFHSWFDPLPEPWRFFRGRASEEMARTPYALLRNILAFRFEIRQRSLVVACQLENSVLIHAR
jgi:class 3 adenylate cyclase